MNDSHSWSVITLMFPIRLFPLDLPHVVFTQEVLLMMPMVMIYWRQFSLINTTRINNNNNTKIVWFANQCNRDPNFQYYFNRALHIWGIAVFTIHILNNNEEWYIISIKYIILYTINYTEMRFSRSCGWEEVEGIAGDTICISKDEIRGL